MAIHAEHIDQMAMFWQKLPSYHRGSMKLLGLTREIRAHMQESSAPA